MLGLRGLNRKVALYMVAVALGGLVVSTIGWGLIYVLFVEPHSPAAQDPFRFYPVDYFALAVFIIIGGLMSVAAAASLSRRIVNPISAFAAAARKVADGDLSARAEIGDHSMGEVVDLAHDFNMMATRLETAVAEAKQWNAAIAHELRTPLTILKMRL